MIPDYYSIAQVADMLGVSKETLRRWHANGNLIPKQHPEDDYLAYHRSQIEDFSAVQSLFRSNWDAELLTKPIRPYTLIELFAGAGGLAIGMAKAGLKSVLLNEIDKDACNTLRLNRPDWVIAEGDIATIDFTAYRDQVDVISGGFPCQAFSYAGKKLGFEDTRGTLFFEFSRAVKEVRPKLIVAENVRGLIKHERGKTLTVIKGVIDELGYVLVEPRVLKAMFYQVPQKRERLFLVGIRKDIADYVEGTSNKRIS